MHGAASAAKSQWLPRGTTNASDPLPTSLLTPAPAGKTHTMLGDTAAAADGSLSAEAGLIPRVVYDIFNTASVVDEDTGSVLLRSTVSVSFLEVYNEQVGYYPLTRRGECHFEALPEALV